MTTNPTEKAPLIREADPEFAKLLAEEQEIERTTARNHPERSRPRPARQQQREERAARDGRRVFQLLLEADRYRDNELYRQAGQLLIEMADRPTWLPIDKRGS